MGRWAAGLDLPNYAGGAGESVGVGVGEARGKAIEEVRGFRDVMGWRRERSEGRGGESGRGRRGGSVGHIARLLRRREGV